MKYEFPKGDLNERLEARGFLEVDKEYHTLKNFRQVRFSVFKKGENFYYLKSSAWIDHPSNGYIEAELIKIKEKDIEKIQ